MSKFFAAAGTVAMLGVAVVPLASYAATSTSTTTVEVTIGEECSLGGSGAGSGGASNLHLNLSATTPNGVITSTETGSSEDIEVVCNNDTWTLTEQINSGHTQNLVGAVVGNTGVFAPWSTGTANDASDFADNTWGMKYTQVTAQAGNAVTATTWHAVPANGSPAAIANGVATAGYQIQQSFGAKTDGALAADTYSSQILYTLTGTDTP